MKFKLKRVDLKLCQNEEKELVVVLHQEKRAAIHGVVKLPNGKPVKGAVVKLFKKCGNPCELIPITFTFTDDCGQFLFGVEAEVEYVVKVFFFIPEHKEREKECEKECDCN